MAQQSFQVAVIDTCHCETLENLQILTNRPTTELTVNCLLVMLIFLWIFGKKFRRRGQCLGRKKKFFFVDFAKKTKSFWWTSII